MEEKVYIKDSDKIRLLEINNLLLTKQNEAILIRDRFIDLNNNIIPRLQSNLEESIRSILKEYDCEGGTIGNDYSISPPQGEVK